MHEILHENTQGFVPGAEGWSVWVAKAETKKKEQIHRVGPNGGRGREAGEAQKRKRRGDKKISI